MEIKKEAWSKFMDTMDYESDDTNFKVPFKTLSKKFGQAYIVFCKAAWEANEDVMTEDEFCQMNGGMPRGFFDKVINK